MENCIIGIDISSKTLDICLLHGTQTDYFKIENSPRHIQKFFEQFDGKACIVAMENTGRYNWYLYDALPKYDFKVYVINALHLSKSQGLVRGKDDRTDAYRVALFAKKNMEDLDPWKPATKTIKKLKVLLTERNARIKSRRRLLKQGNDYAKMKDIGLDRCLAQWNKQQIGQLDKQIRKIESLIEQLIREEPILKRQREMMLSIPGVGKVTAWTVLGKTEGFTKITDPRKMACYSGVVPFEHQSGTSVYRKPKVSLYSDKQIKSVLHLAAMSAIRLKNDLQHYYMRKVKEGKNKMSVLNAVRNKIIHLIFAIIKSGKFYENRLDMS